MSLLSAAPILALDSGCKPAYNPLRRPQFMSKARGLKKAAQKLDQIQGPCYRVLTSVHYGVQHSTYYRKSTLSHVVVDQQRPQSREDAFPKVQAPDEPG
jgi:hypothetical protein